MSHPRMFIAAPLVIAQSRNSPMSTTVEWINILGNTQTVKQFTLIMNECVILHMSIWMSLTNLMVSRVSQTDTYRSTYCS